MFVANVLTVWVEALKTLFGPDNETPELRNLPVVTNYPLEEVNYPGLWVNFLVQGDVENVGIGHVEYQGDDVGAGVHEVYRWKFGGLVEITIGSMGNLERALLVDEISKAFAIARVGENPQGELRRQVSDSDLIGMNVVWESFAISGFAETPGTPWGTDDVIYEATIGFTVQGEVILDPVTGTLVPFSALIVTPLLEGDPGVPVQGVGGWL